MMWTRRVRWPAVGVVAVLVVGCESDPTEPGETADPRTLMVDASEAWAYVRLGDPATVVSVTDASTSTAWDMAFLRTAVTLNGGAAGPGGVQGYCICQNAGATPAQVMAMTPESELAAFESVDASSIPADESAWSSDALAPVIDGWWSYNPMTHQVSAVPTRLWIVRSAETTSPVYAKLRVVDVLDPAQSHAGRVAIEYAVQPTAGGSFGAVQHDTIDVSGGRVYYDLAAGGESTESDWDLAFEGYTIRVNGGVSGSGKAGALLTSTPFEQVSDANDVPSELYAADTFSGVFEAHPWYRYNLANAHGIWPTYDVYLIRRGTTVYKVQLIGYYGPAGEDRRITFRAERIAG